MGKRHRSAACVAWVYLTGCLLSSASVAAGEEPLPATCAPPPQPPLAVRKRARTSSSAAVEMIGLFDVHEGSRCHLLRPGGVEQTMMALGVIENRLRYELTDADDNGTADIGFRAFDTCSNVQTAIQRLINGLMEANALNESCRSNFVGVIGSSNPVVQHHVGNLLQSLKIPYFPFQITSLRYEIEAMVEVLSELRWLKVAVFSANVELQEEFRRAADSRDICISSSVVLSASARSTAALQDAFARAAATQTRVVAVLGSSSELQSLYEAAAGSNGSVQSWLLAGLESDESVLSLSFGPEHPIILFRRSPARSNSPPEPLPARDFGDSYEFATSLRRLHAVRSYVEYLGDCGDNATGKCEGRKTRPVGPLWAITLEAAERLITLAFKKDMENETVGNETKSENSKKNETSKHQEIEIWTYEQAIGKFSKHKELQVGHYNGGHLLLNKKRLNVFRFMGSGWFKIPEYQCINDCPETCLNYETISPTPNYSNLFSRIYHNWRHETWITAMLTVSVLGIIVTLLVIVYFAVKSFQDDCEDRAQVFSIVTLIAVALAYGCTILFMFYKDSSSSCSKRITVVGLAYVGMLAPIVSRVFLMIAAESEGIHGHVSGLLQIVLACFIAAVQIALAACFWWLYPASVPARYRCRLGDKTLVLSYLSYAIFLSALWLVASPFCARSRRNHREGLLLHLSSVAVCMLWVAWFLLLFLLGSRWSEFVVSLGLVATATAVLVAAFLPQVYRMVAAAAAGEQVSMQPVIFASSSSRSPNMSIYESVNHGYNVADKDGYVVDVFRDDCDSPTPRKMTHL